MQPTSVTEKLPEGVHRAHLLLKIYVDLYKMVVANRVMVVQIGGIW